MDDAFPWRGHCVYSHSRELEPMSERLTLPFLPILQPANRFRLRALRAKVTVAGPRPMAIRQLLPIWPPARGTRECSRAFSRWHGRCFPLARPLCLLTLTRARAYV